MFVTRTCFCDDCLCLDSKHVIPSQILLFILFYFFVFQDKLVVIAAAGPQLGENSDDSFTRDAALLMLTDIEKSFSKIQRYKMSICPDETVRVTSSQEQNTWWAVGTGIKTGADLYFSN